MARAPALPRTVDGLAACVHDLVVDLDVVRPVMMGHLFGAAVAFTSSCTRHLAWSRTGRINARSPSSWKAYRLVGILDGCLKTDTAYDQATICRTTKSPLQLDTKAPARTV
jgi:hypothetical protein